MFSVRATVQIQCVQMIVEGLTYRVGYVRGRIVIAGFFVLATCLADSNQL